MKTISTISRRDLLRGLGSVSIVLASGRSAWPAIGTGPVSFVDVAGLAGITFHHDNAASSEKYLIETMAKQPSGATNSNTVMSPLAQTGVFTFTQGGVTHNVNLLTDIAGGASGVNPCCVLPTVVNPDVGSIFSNISSSLSAGSVTPNSDANLVDVHWGYPTPLTQYFPTVRVDYNMLRKQSKEVSSSDITYGIIRGWSEHDSSLKIDPYRFMRPTGRVI